MSGKKISIKIENLDEPNMSDKQEKQEPNKKERGKEAIRRDIRQKLVGAVPDHWIDLASGDDTGKEPEKKKERLEKTIRLDEKKESSNDVASRMRERINSFLGRGESSVVKKGTAEEEAIEAGKPADEIVEEETAEAKEGTVKTKKISKKIKGSNEKKGDDSEHQAAIKKGAGSGEPVQSAEPGSAEGGTKELSKKIDVSLKLYRNIAIFFIIGAIIVISVVFYFTAVKLTIDISPKKEMVSDSLLFEVDDNSVEASGMNINHVSGAVSSLDIEKEQDFPATGAKVIGEDAVGTVTIYNNYIKSQPLVATTRLLTPDGQLFRIKDTVNVPAGSSIDVDVYADKPTSDLVVGPTKFTIPGLWAGIQDKIYGESKETIKFEQQTESYIQQSDIDDAIANLKQSMEKEAEQKVSSAFPDYKKKLFKIDDKSIVSAYSVKAGDKASEFTVKLKALVAVVAFDDDEVLKMAKEKLITNVETGKELSDFGDQAVNYSLDSVNLVDKIASVNAGFIGSMMINEDSGVIDRSKIVGLNEKMLRSYLSNIGEIDSYNLAFYPSWWHFVPRLVDRITVNLQKK